MSKQREVSIKILDKECNLIGFHKLENNKEPEPCIVINDLHYHYTYNRGVYLQELPDDDVPF